MTIKNVRQFNNELNSFFKAGIDGITDILSFSTRMIELHGNKERLQSFFNHPQLRTQSGTVRAQFKKQAQYMMQAVPAIELGYFEFNETTNKNEFNKYSLDTLPANITGKDIHINKDKSFEFIPFDEWVNKANEQGAKEEKPVKPIKASTFITQLQKINNQGIDGDNTELVAISELLKMALNKVADAIVSDDPVTVLAAGILADVPPSAKSRSAGLKVAI